MYALREAVKNTVRMPYMTLISIVTITITLIVLGVLGITTLLGHGTLKKVRMSEEINVYLLDSMKDEDMLALDAVISAMTEVSSTTILSKDDARKEFNRTFGEDLVSALDKNPLPRSIVIHMKDDHATYDDLEHVAKRISSASGVESVEYGREWMSKLDLVFTVFLIAEIVCIFFSLGACLLIISNTISLTVLARKETIDIMRLVGATDGFVRRPFYFEGFLQGFLAGSLTFGFLFGVWSWMERIFPNIDTFMYMVKISGQFTLSHSMVIASIIPVGAILGFIGSFIAVRRVF